EYFPIGHPMLSAGQAGESAVALQRNAIHTATRWSVATAAAKASRSSSGQGQAAAAVSSPGVGGVSCLPSVSLLRSLSPREASCGLSGHPGWIHFSGNGCFWGAAKSTSFGGVPRPVSMLSATGTDAPWQSLLSRCR
ncbi:hypothetical protein TcCL_ESM11691, partial [Trypanosoma cruzi]